MLYGLLADALVLVHVAFVIFVTLGGLLVWKRHRLAWVHLPAVAWGVWIEWSGGDLSTDATGKLAPRRERRRNLPRGLHPTLRAAGSLSSRTHPRHPDRARRAGARDQRGRVLVCMEEDQD